jgi:hypothetical protein
MGLAVGFIYNEIWFESGSRLTGVWQWRWPGADDADDLLVLLSKVSLGEGQDGALESDFLSSHVPWAFGGIHGVGPDGAPWVIVVQVAPASASDLVSSGNPWWCMVDALDRTVDFNAEAEVRTHLGLSRTDLIRAYVEAGVPVESLGDWSVPDLVLGLLAECTYVPLQQIVAGAVTGCSLPDIDHECQHDPFRDAFAAWMAGLVASPPEPYEEERQGEGDDEESGPDDWTPPRRLPHPNVRWSWKKGHLRKWSTDRLRLQAVEEGWSAKKARKASRRKLVKYLSTPHRLRPRLPGTPRVSEPAVVHRVVLEESRAMASSDMAVVATYVDGALHVAQCDYGDGDESTRGFDVDEPLALLAALLEERFGSLATAFDDYLDRHFWRSGVLELDMVPLASAGHVRVTAGPGTKAFIWDSRAWPEQVLRIDDWPSLTLALLADRVQGRDAYAGAQALMERCDIGVTPRDRGYV